MKFDDVKVGDKLTHPRFGEELHAQVARKDVKTEPGCELTGEITIEVFEQMKYRGHARYSKLEFEQEPFEALAKV